MGIYAVYLATFNYLADVYHKYASSALAAQSFCRNMMGAVFPLVTKALFGGLGIGGACSLLGGIVSLIPLLVLENTDLMSLGYPLGSCSVGSHPPRPSYSKTLQVR